MLLNTDASQDPMLIDSGHRTYLFGEFVLDIDRGTLLKESLDVPLRPKSFEVLRYFVSHPGVLLSKRELLASVWGDVVVTEDSLTQCLIEIRKALGDRSRKMIRTMPKRGYIFDVPVTKNEPATEAQTALRNRTFFSNRRPSVWSMGAILLLTLAVVFTWWNHAQNSQPGHRGQDTVLTAAPDSIAMQHNLRGRFFHNRRAPGDLERAIEQFHQALDADPGQADAWVGLAGSLFVQAHEVDGLFSEDILASYKSALERALELSPDNAEAHARLSRYYCKIFDFDRSQQHLEYAVEHGQNSPLVLSIAAGTALLQSRFNEAIDLQRRAASFDPLGYVNRGNLANMLYSAGRLDEAELEFNKALDLNPQDRMRVIEPLMGIHIHRKQYDEAETLAQQLPDSVSRDQAMAIIHRAQGREAESDWILAKLSANPEVEPAVALAEIYAFLAMFDEAFGWLNLATERQFIADDDAHQDSDFLSDMRISPFLRPLRVDPRWAFWLEGTKNRIAERYSNKISLAVLSTKPLEGPPSIDELADY
jgi:DNA-binding winged helix-turn-helix (wHTH) protein/tetratricopeptide (TPR) repeat protein